MKRILGIGDNTVDLYLHMGQMFPGGNAVNVPVLMARLGHQASYLGCLGEDTAGRLILNTLQKEGIDVSRCQMIPGANAWSKINLVEGDRVFAGSSKGVSVDWNLGAADFDFVAEHDLAHSSVYSGLEFALADIRKAAKLFSFDFSSEWNREYLQQVVPYLDIAFLSAPKQSTGECEDLLTQIIRLGAKLAVLTRGKLGSMAFDGQRMYQQGIVEAKIVDTLGAGDAFIAAFLGAYLEGANLESSLLDGAIYAARNCQVYGAFGYGVHIAADLIPNRWLGDT